MHYDPDTGTINGYPLSDVFIAAAIGIFCLVVFFVMINMSIRWYRGRFHSENFVVKETDESEWLAADNSNKDATRMMAQQIASDPDGNLEMRLLRLKRKSEAVDSENEL